MTGNMKKFLDWASGQTGKKAEIQALCGLDEVAAYAKAHGFKLSSDDLAPGDARIDEDEMAAVTGGKAAGLKECSCLLAGAGLSTNASHHCICIDIGLSVDPYRP